VECQIVQPLAAARHRPPLDGPRRLHAGRVAISLKENLAWLERSTGIVFSAPPERFTNFQRPPRSAAQFLDIQPQTSVSPFAGAICKLKYLRQISSSRFPYVHQSVAGLKVLRKRVSEPAHFGVRGKCGGGIRRPLALFSKQTKAKSPRFDEPLSETRTSGRGDVSASKTLLEASLLKRQKNCLAHFRCDGPPESCMGYIQPAAKCRGKLKKSCAKLPR